MLFDGAGHAAVWSMPDRFLRELVARVRPLAVRPESGVKVGLEIWRREGNSLLTFQIEPGK